MGVTSSWGQQESAEQQSLGVSTWFQCPREPLIQAGEPLVEPRDLSCAHSCYLGTRLMRPYVVSLQAVSKGWHLPAPSLSSWD